MTIVIAPDPTTRKCPKHPDQLHTDTIRCVRCEGTRLVDEFLTTLTTAIRESVRP